MRLLHRTIQRLIAAASVQSISMGKHQRQTRRHWGPTDDNVQPSSNAEKRTTWATCLLPWVHFRHSMRLLGIIFRKGFPERVSRKGVLLLRKQRQVVVIELFSCLNWPLLCKYHPSASCQGDFHGTAHTRSNNDDAVCSDIVAHNKPSFQSMLNEAGSKTLRTNLLYINSLASVNGVVSAFLGLWNSSTGNNKLWYYYLWSNYAILSLRFLFIITRNRCGWISVFWIGILLRMLLSPRLPSSTRTKVSTCFSHPTPPI